MPVERKGVPESLSFFSRASVEAGTIVEVPVRSRSLPALVTDVQSVSDAKLDLKSLPYPLRKVKNLSNTRMFSSSFIRAVARVSEYHLVSRSHTLAQVTFRSLLNEAEKIESCTETKPQVGPVVKPKLLITETEERVTIYRTMARDALSEKKSLLIVCPSLNEAEQLFTSLSRGISDHTALLASTVRPHELRESWNKAVTGEKRIIVGTPAALSCPIDTLHTIVVERESARAYRSRHYPYVDTRRLAHALAHAHNIELVLSDFPMRTETRALVDRGEATESIHKQLRPTSFARIEVIDAAAERKEKSKSSLYQPFGDNSARAIAAAADANRKAVVYAARKGIGSFTVCGDCGQAVVDPVTKTPMSLHKTESGNIFVSYMTGTVLPAVSSCATCGGWNLITLGIGVDKVYDSLKRFVPGEKLFLLTSDSAKTHRDARAITDAWNEKGGVLVGTERMLPYIKTPYAVSVVASIDSTLSLPQWNADSNALQTLFAIREYTEDLMLVETRRPDHNVIKTIESGDIQAFYIEQMEERRRFQYPPYTTFIGLTWHGNLAHTNSLGERVKKYFSDYKLFGPFPVEQIAHEHYTSRAVLKAAEWPDADLQTKLAALTSDVTITVDPEEIV